MPRRRASRLSRWRRIAPAAYFSSSAAPILPPPPITVPPHGRAGDGDPPYFILSPAGYPLIGPGVPGLMILDRFGQIVWYSPNTDFPAKQGTGRVDLQVQTYRGQPVLTWWEGRVDLRVRYGEAI